MNAGTRYAPSQLEFFSRTEGRVTGVRPGVEVGPVVGRVLHDRVVGNAEVVQELKQLAYVHVVLDHAVRVFVVALGPAVRPHMRSEVHAGAVPPGEERLAGLHLARDEVLGGFDGFVVDGFHTLLGQRTGVDNRLPALAVGGGLDHAARAELFRNSGSSDSPRSPAPPRH